MTIFNTTKQTPRLTDQDIQLLFGLKPTPTELAQTSGSYIAAPEGQFTTLARQSVSDLISKLRNKEIHGEIKPGGTEPARVYPRALASEPTSADHGDSANLEMAMLSAAAEASEVYDVSPFVRASKAINWTGKSADEFVFGIRLALKIGALMIARELAMNGNQSYPDHSELAKMARILAPPKATIVEGEPNTSWKENKSWLKDHWTEYQGRWVALRSGQLLADAANVNDLVAQVGEIKGTGILLTLVG